MMVHFYRMKHLLKVDSVPVPGTEPSTLSQSRYLIFSATAVR